MVSALNVNAIFSACQLNHNTYFFRIHHISYNFKIFSTFFPVFCESARSLLKYTFHNSWMSINILFSNLFAFFVWMDVSQKKLLSGILLPCLLLLSESLHKKWELLEWLLNSLSPHFSPSNNTNKSYIIFHPYTQMQNDTQYLR